MQRPPELATPARAGVRQPRLAQGVVATYLALVVLVPLVAVAWRAARLGPAGFWDSVTQREALDALALTLACSALVVAVNAVSGTLIAWVLVRDDFRGKGLVNALIDLPFALPTIVAGLTLLSLYGPQSPLGISIAYTRTAIVVALLFETLPFVVRAVQPVLLELDAEVEDAAASLGASRAAIFQRVILPSLRPALLSGVALGFARAVGEFGAVVLISGNIPRHTEVAAVQIFGRIESNDTAGAAALSVVLLAISLAVLLAVGAAGRLGGSDDH